MQPQRYMYDMYMTLVYIYICELSTMLRKFCFYVSNFVEKNEIQTSAPRNSVTDAGDMEQAESRTPNLLTAGHQGHNTNL